MPADRLAIDGGTPVRAGPMPPRRLLGAEEKAAAVELFDEAIRTGDAFGYGGRPEQEYEREFTQFMGGGYADAVNSGTNALYCALGGLRIEPFSEVIVPPISDPGGVMPVPLLGLVPVGADADPRSYNTGAEQIEPMITERTRAIVVAHIGGDPVDMDPVMSLARRHDLYVIEDCAQAHGATYKGRLAGTIGHAAAFSTMSGKHHCTGGQGGVVFTHDEDLHWRARRFADRGKPFNLDASGNVVAGLNCNLNDLSAAIGRVQLRKLPEVVAARRRVAQAVREGTAQLDTVSVGWQVPDSESVYWFLRVRIELDALRVGKAEFVRALQAEGIPAAVAYRHIPCEQPWFLNKAVFGSSGFPWGAGDKPRARFANAIRATDTHFNISIHEGYGERETGDIVAALAKVERAFRRH